MCSYKHGNHRNSQKHDDHKIESGIWKKFSRLFFESIEEILNPMAEHFKNQKQFLDSLVVHKEPFVRRVKLDRDLLKAIQNHEFQVYYQPIVNLQNGSILSMEALIRWKHPELGMIEPYEFIPLAEEAQLMDDIGKWVIEEACSQLSLWQKQGFIKAPLKIGINLSSSQLKQVDFLSSVRKMLKKTGIDKDYLEFEFGHGRIIDKTILASINKLVSSGFTVSIDDFGIGDHKWMEFNSFSTIKIDRSLIKEIKNNEAVKGIIASMLSKASAAGMKTVAEGIESEAELQFLKDLKCDYGQGYFFSKPIPAVEFLHLLQSPA